MAQVSVPLQRLDRRTDRIGATGICATRPRGNVTKLYVGIGHNFGDRPADLVGAIAGEARIRSRDIGHIDIADTFSLVEVPRASLDAIIKALQKTTIRGKKVTVRRERGK